MYSDKYWITPSGKILDGSGFAHHIEAVNQSPESFGLSQDYLDETYADGGERCNLLLM